MQQIAKAEAGILHSLDKCPGLMTPWQPCLQRVQGHNHSGQRAAPSSKASGCKFGGLLYYHATIFLVKVLDTFCKRPGKKHRFGVLVPLTNGENQPTKEKKIKRSSMPTAVVVIAKKLKYVICACSINLYFVFVRIFSIYSITQNCVMQYLNSLIMIALRNTYLNKKVNLQASILGRKD